jgi:hypothetical protein
VTGRQETSVPDQLQSLPRDFEPFHRSLVMGADDDGNEFFVLGHPEQRYAIAAATALQRALTGRRYKSGTAGAGVIVIREWVQFVVHSDWPDYWRFDSVAPDKPGAHQVTRIVFDWRHGDIEDPACPSRCPGCTRMTTTLWGGWQHEHLCRRCGTKWPALDRHRAA